MAELSLLINTIRNFFIGLISLPLWGKALAVVIAFYSPVQDLALLAVLAMGLDVLSAIYASLATEKGKGVITSTKFRKKILELIPFSIGLTGLLALDHSLPGISLMGFKAPEFFFSSFFCILSTAREVISILENGARAGNPASKTLANILKIKTKELTEEIKDSVKIEKKD